MSAINPAGTPYRDTYLLMNQPQDAVQRSPLADGESTLQSMIESEEAMIERYMNSFWEYQNEIDYGPFYPAEIEPSKVEAFTRFRNAARNPNVSIDSIFSAYSWLDHETRNELHFNIWQNLGCPQTHGENTGYIHLRLQPHSPAVLDAIEKLAAAHPDLLTEKPHIVVNDEEFTGAKYLIKSVAAASVGIVPFLTSKVGEGIVKGFAFITEEGKTVLSKFGPIGEAIGTGLRIAAGIPALIGGSLLFGGAVIFSKSQQLIWGREWIEHPLEERVHTQLGRYGTGSKPSEDFSNLVKAFFCFSDCQKADQLLSEIRKFKAT